MLLASNQPAVDEPCTMALLLAPQTDRTKHKYRRLILTWLWSLFAFYLIFNFLLLLFKHYVACSYISNWTVGITNFDPGPAFWADHHLFPDAPGQYANINFTVSIKNNPSWMKVCIRSIRLVYALGDILALSRIDLGIHGDAELPVKYRISLGSAGLAYPCLGHILSIDDSVVFLIALDVEPSFLGQDVGLLSINTIVPLGTLQRNVTISSEAAHICERSYYKSTARKTFSGSRDSQVRVTVSEYDYLLIKGNFSSPGAQAQ